MDLQFSISLLSPFLHMADMIPVLEAIFIVPSVPRSHKHLKGQGPVHLKSVYKLPALRPSLPGDLLFVWEFIDFMILSKDVSASQTLKSSLDI